MDHPPQPEPFYTLYWTDLAPAIGPLAFLDLLFMTAVQSDGSERHARVDDDENTVQKLKKGVE